MKLLEYLKPLLLVLLLGLPCVGKAQGLANCIQVLEAQLEEKALPVKLEHAVNFSILRFSQASVVSVHQPWQGAQQAQHFLLGSQGIKFPSACHHLPRVTTPARRVIATSTTHLTYLSELGWLESLVGFSQAKWVYSAQVRQLLKQGKIIEVGADDQLNLEALVTLNPQVVFSFATGKGQLDGLNKLTAVGIVPVTVAEYLERSPLGTAEWLRFFAEFFGEAAKAESQFRQIVEQYEALRAKIEQVERRPVVLVNADYQGIWYVAGGNSLTARYIADAGGDYLFKDEPITGFIPMDIEAVLVQGAQAEIWINPSSWTSLGQALRINPQYAQFPAFKNGQVFNNNKKVHPAGGNAFYEETVVAPHKVLADLISIFHPEVLPAHQRVWYQQLQ